MYGFGRSNCTFILESLFLRHLAWPTSRRLKGGKCSVILSVYLVHVVVFRRAAEFLETRLPHTRNYTSWLDLETSNTKAIKDTNKQTSYKVTKTTTSRIPSGYFVSHTWGTRSQQRQPGSHTQEIHAQRGMCADIYPIRSRVSQAAEAKVRHAATTR